MCRRWSRRSIMDKKNLVNTRLVNGVGRASTAIVEFNSNAISGDFLKQLNSALDQIENFQDTEDVLQRITSVVFISKKNKIFLAGADLFALKKHLTVPFLLDAIVQAGQDTFNRISSLKIPTVAAINGACLGGGLELALACDYRICSYDKSTKIGLPEVNLGILPAWGGTTRLPRLIGLPNALTAILAGKMYAPKPAKRVGIVNRVVHKENLQSAAIALVRADKCRERKKGFAEHIPSCVVLKKARSNVLRKTKGNYPAPLKILDVVSKSLRSSVNESLALEREAFIELAQTNECKNLLRIFFLQEKSKKLKRLDQSKGVSVHPPIKDAVVVGAGTMGAGIAQWVSSRGVNVLLKDVNEELVGGGLKTIGDLYVQGVLGYKMDRPTARNGLARVTTSTIDTPLHSKDILIEAIVEDLSVKQKVLAQLEEQLPDDAIIATNTSALSIDEMADCLKRPGRFVGIHFFNPVHKMKLVEVVRGKHTTDETVYRAVRFVQQIGKMPVIVKDSPGFVVNRILVPYLIKAADMLMDGHQMEAIDGGMVKFGMPMGPFRLMDEIGLDICYHVADDLKNRLDIVCSLEEIRWRMECNMLGRKSGEGFYTYKKGRSIKKKVKKSVDVTCLVESMTVEARKVLDERVIDDPDMLDFAMIMGTGWAPFRGGPIRYSTQLPEVGPLHSVGTP